MKTTVRILLAIALAPLAVALTVGMLITLLSAMAAELVCPDKHNDIPKA